MKRVLLLSLFFLLFAAADSFAAEDEQKGAHEAAYEHASEKSVFNRFGDWFATVGKSEEEKAKILEERNARRMEAQEKKRLQRSEKEMTAEPEDAQEPAAKKGKESKEKAEDRREELQNTAEEMTSDRPNQSPEETKGAKGKGRQRK